MFRLAAELESHATDLCLEVLQHLTIALAGVDCCELFTLLVAFFGQGSEFQEDQFNYLDDAPKIQPPLDITDTDSDDEVSVVGEEAVPSPPVTLSESQVVVLVPAPSVSPAPSFPQREPQVKSRPKATYADKAADISMTQGFLSRGQGFPPQHRNSHSLCRLPLRYLWQGKILVYVSLW